MPSPPNRATTQKRILETPLAMLEGYGRTRSKTGLTVKTINLLDDKGYVYVKDLMGVRRRDLLALAWISVATVDSIVEALHQFLTENKEME